MSSRTDTHNGPYLYPPRANVRGFAQLPFYQNPQFPDKKTACGLAAAFTMLTNYKHKTFGDSDFENVKPNLGPFGTTAGRVEEIMKSYGGTVHFHKDATLDAGVVALKGSIVSHSPACVLLDLGAASDLKQSWFAGHWVVAYAFDNSEVHLTNYGPMAWDSFKRCFDKTVLTNGGGMGRAHYTLT